MKSRQTQYLALDLGAEVRQIRKARGLTLKQLSLNSGISLSHLSAIERGVTSPSLDMITQLCEHLSVRPNWLFSERLGEGPMERAYIVRKEKRRNLNQLYGQRPGDLGYSDALLSSSIGGQFYMGLAEYAPKSDKPSSHIHQHDGEQHGIVIEGVLELTLKDETMILQTGDSYSFPARIPHHAHNPSQEVTRLVWAVTPVVIPSVVSLPNEDD